MARPLLSSRSVHPRNVLFHRTRLLVWVLVALLCGATVYLRYRSISSQQSKTIVAEEAGRSEQHDTDIATLNERATVTSEAEAIADALKEASARPCFTDQCQVVRDDPPATNVTLLVGILSDATADADLRKAGRETWVQHAWQQPGVEAVFFFPEHSPALAQEQAQYGDVVVPPAPIANMSAGVQMLLHLSSTSTARNILRVNVGQYIVVRRILARLAEACERPDCVKEQIWAGSLVQQRPVEGSGTEQYKWDTGLQYYLPYMRKEAYVMSRTLAAALKLIHEHVGLRWWVGPEESSMGLWLVPVPVKRMQWATSMHLQPDCCVSRAGLIVDICKPRNKQGHLPLVVNVHQSVYMRRYHEALEQCN
jgi:hypothetical protein